MFWPLLIHGTRNRVDVQMPLHVLIHDFLFQFILFLQNKNNISAADVARGVCHKPQMLYVFKDMHPPKFSSIKKGR